MRSAGRSRESKEGLRYLRQQLIVIDFSWIRKRGGVHNNPRRKTRFQSIIAVLEMGAYIGRVLR